MIYLNQAATTWPKPETVKKAVEAGIALPPSSQNRGAGKQDEDIAVRCRKELAGLFHTGDYQRFYFTSGATDAFNRIIRGLELEESRVLITANEHNAVLRPLCNIYRNLKMDVAGCDRQGRLDYADFEEKLKSETGAVFVNHCSNVTGQSVNLKKIARLVHQKSKALLVVDASQSAGVLDIDLSKTEIDILVFTGHKGLYGPQGTGGFYLSPEVFLKPVVYGGTGYDSRRLVMEEGWQEYEIGTQNYHGLYGLCAGIEFVRKTGLEKIRQKEQELMGVLTAGLRTLKGVEMYGTENRTDVLSGPVLSFNLRGLKPADVAYYLAESYGITVRSGFHCAPLIHRALGCAENGTVRVSVSCFNRVQEIELLVEAIRELEKSLC